MYGGKHALSHHPSLTSCAASSALHLLCVQRNATGYFNVLNDEGRVVVGALLACDPDAKIPEIMPEQKEPMWDRSMLSTKGDNI